MSDLSGIPEGSPRTGVWKHGRLEVAGPADWPEGTRFRVIPLVSATSEAAGAVIVAGFGLAGRYIAELLAQQNVPFCIIDSNPATIRTQQELGLRVVEGDVSSPDVLLAAGILQATLVALTIPDEESTMRAIAAAHALKPDVHIIARFAHASKGIEAMRVGAAEVVTAEQEVALRFHERVACLLSQPIAQPSGACAL